MSRPDVAAILVAGGSSTRFGRPKQFEVIGDLPMYQYVTRTYSRLAEIGRIVLVGPSAYLTEMEAGIRGLSIDTPWTVFAGGETRQDSVSNGLASLRDDTDSPIVIVHDVARALVDEVVIHAVIHATREHGSAIAAIPVVDTLKRVKDGKIAETVSRQNLWRAQTPQGARKELLLAAFDAARASGYQGTDEAEILERIGQQPFVVEGSELNFKVTYPEDLARARFIAGSRGL